MNIKIVLRTIKKIIFFVVNIIFLKVKLHIIYKMQGKLTGYLNFSNNCDLQLLSNGGDLNSLKNIYIKILDNDEILKLRNIMNNFNEHKVDKLNMPIKICNEGGYLVKLNTIKFSKCLSNAMLNTPRDKWNNQEYLVKFKILKYEFKTKNTDSIIKGARFLLTSIKLNI